VNAKKLVAVSGVCIVLAFCCLAFVVFRRPHWIPDRRVNTLREYVDVKAGRRRVEGYLLWRKVTDRVEETELSQLYRRLAGEPPSPVWRRVNTFRYGAANYSPQHVHHESLWAAGLLTTCLGQTEFTPEAKRAAVLTFLELLEKYDRDTEARAFVLMLCKVAGERARSGNGPMGVGDLPAAPGLVGQSGAGTGHPQGFAGPRGV
jgi:hypothetical protein